MLQFSREAREIRQERFRQLARLLARRQEVRQLIAEALEPIGREWCESASGGGHQRVSFAPGAQDARRVRAACARPPRATVFGGYFEGDVEAVSVDTQVRQERRRAIERLVIRAAYLAIPVLELVGEFDGLLAV